MVQLNGSWGWYSAVDAAHTTQYLPKDKQFLGATNVISKTRCKDLVAGSGVTLQVVLILLFEGRRLRRGNDDDQRTLTRK